MEFSRQEYWSGLPFPSPGDLPSPGIKPWSPILQADALQSEPPGKLKRPLQRKHGVLTTGPPGNSPKLHIFNWHSSPKACWVDFSDSGSGKASNQRRWGCIGRGGWTNWSLRFPWLGHSMVWGTVRECRVEPKHLWASSLSVNWGPLWGKGGRVRKAQASFPASVTVLPALLDPG